MMEDNEKWGSENVSKSWLGRFFFSNFFFFFHPVDYDKTQKCFKWKSDVFCILEWFLFLNVKDRVAAAKSLQLCLTLCDPIDGSPPGFPVPGILQARTLEWVAMTFSSVLSGYN